MTDRTVPRIAENLDELVAGATDRVEVRTSDARSGARFERLVIDGERCFLKSLSAADDWIMRVTGNTSNWEFKVWQAGIYADTPSVIDHTIRGMALEGDRLSILMADCGDDLVPPGDDRCRRTTTPTSSTRWPRCTRTSLVRILPAGTTTSGCRTCPDGGCSSRPTRSRLSSRRRRFRARSRSPTRDGGCCRSGRPGSTSLVRDVHRDPEPLSDALRATPLTFVGGDWKLGNVGHRPNGRTILLDWAYPGEAPPCWDLTWYLALNRARLPESKEATIAHYRECLEARGVDTTEWWDRQLGLSLLGMAAVFAWEKAVGDQDELDWWERAALDGARWL